jgi:hypothetical protein
MEPSPRESSTLPLPSEICIAIDTEFEGGRTLTVQAAVRLSPDDVAVQVYHAPTVPPLPGNFDLTPLGVTRTPQVGYLERRGKS